MLLQEDLPREEVGHFRSLENVIRTANAEDFGPVLFKLTDAEVDKREHDEVRGREEKMEKGLVLSLVLSSNYTDSI